MAGKNIYIVGGGASGLTLATRHIEAGDNVTIIDVKDVIDPLKLNQGFQFGYKGGELRGFTLKDSQLIAVEDKASLAALPRPDLVYCTVTNTRSPDGKTGIEPGLETAMQVAKGAYIFELSNGSKDYYLGNLKPFEEKKVVFGALLHPAKKEGTIVTALCADGNFIEGNGILLADTNYDTFLPKECSISEKAGIGVKTNNSVREVFYDKAGAIVSMAPQMMLGTKFADASKRDNPTGELTARMVEELYAIRAAQEGGHAFTFNRNAGQFLEEQQGIMAKKGASPGSMDLMAKQGKPLEIDAIFGALSKEAKRLGVECPTIEAVHSMAAKYYAARTKPAREQFTKDLSAAIEKDGIDNLVNAVALGAALGVR